MRTQEIANLLTPFLKAPLSVTQLELVRDYLDLLLRWNERINLTAVRRPEEIVTRHFGESFFLAEQLLDPTWCGHVADVGSGAGFPGVPIAIYAPQARVSLIESNNKKAAFLRELTRALRMHRIAVFAGRAEDFAQSGGTSAPDLVTLRAVEKFETAVPVAASLLGAVEDTREHDGRLALLIGAGQEEVAKKLAEGFSWKPPTPTPGSTRRVLLVGNLVG